MSVLFRQVFYAVDEDDYRDNIWKKHPNEASEAYDYFMRYYVPNERTIDGYRLFLFDKGMLNEEDFNATKNISSKFKFYESGKNKEGDEIEGLHEFKERKDAFELTGISTPPRLTDTSLEDIKKLRVNIIRQELLDADVLLQQWLLQMAVFSNYVTEQQVKKENGNGQNSSTLSTLTKARKDISFLVRRAAGLSDKAEEELLEEATEQEIKITYKEEEIDVRQYEAIDFASLESFEKIINSDDYEDIVEKLSIEYEKHSTKDS